MKNLIVIGSCDRLLLEFLKNLVGFDVLLGVVALFFLQIGLLQLLLQSWPVLHVGKLHLAHELTEPDEDTAAVVASAVVAGGDVVAVVAVAACVVVAAAVAAAAVAVVVAVVHHTHSPVVRQLPSGEKQFDSSYSLL